MFVRTFVQLRYRFRIYPTPGQQVELAKAFGCARVVFNDGLRLRQQAWEAGQKFVSDGELSKLVITHAKKTPQRAWLAEVSAVVLQQALRDLNVAYRNFSGRSLANVRVASWGCQSSGPARIIGRPSVSLRAPGSGSWTTVA